MAGIDTVLARLDANRDAALQRLFDFLRIPSISADPTYTADCRRAAEWCANELKGLGFDASVRDTIGHPMVLGHARAKRRDVPHVLFYGHYDVQPVDPLELWTTKPFEPTLANGPNGQQIVARGACDDKGQLMTFVEAVRAFRETGDLPCDISILFEGEEESGSRSLPGFMADNAKELKADLMLVCDTGMWDAQTPAITTMLRGILLEEIRIKAADRDLHSGMYGGAAINPIRVLARILADLHDADGRVQVKDFYAGVEELPDEVAEQWRNLKFDSGAFLGDVGLSQPAGEKGRSVLEQVWSRPTCDVNGIVGGYTLAGSKTVLPAEASAKISFRLVGRQDPDAIRRNLRDFVEARLPADCEVEYIPHGGSPALQLPFASEALSRARRALAQEWDREPVMAGCGGSIPIVGDFKAKLGMDALLVGFGLDDDKVHSPNEKYELASFQKGARSWARILAALSN
ncbi:MAG: M20/M25/M40 family metallo-hydrolase [Rhizobiales bacterium]|nr:M20/M25/M40 family metallo-hydrolase [Hyphomicrobiales bacterium]